MTKNKEEILKDLNKAFNKFKFFAEDHHYEYNGKRVGISVTKLIEEYTNEFDKELIAKKVAQKENKTIKQVLNDWKYKNEFACTKGTTCHEYAQSLWSGEPWLLDNFDFSPKYEVAVYKIKQQAENFYNDYKDKWVHLADEFIIGSEEYDIASAVDHLFIVDGEIYLIDYKTNSYMTGVNKEAYKKPMKSPLQHLNDDAITHYYLQLSIYKYLIEKYTKLKIKEMFIIYMSENLNNYMMIDIPYLKEEVEEIMEWRKWE